MYHSFHKIIACSAAAALLCGLLTSCGKDSDEAAYTPHDVEDTTVYSVAVCRSEDNDYYNTITTGFTDALYDTLGEAHVTITDTAITDDSGEMAVLGLLSGDCELLFSVGSKSLSAAANATSITPIVGAGIINYEDVLHLIADGDSWDRLTGRNITGISGAPSTVDMVSLLIEATPDLQAVGILYDPLDDDAIYQNERLETYLDQAGIPWKEYEMTDGNDSDATPSTDSTPTVVLPSTIVAASGKEGANIDVESIGEDGSLTGINSPDATRTAKTSAIWTGGKVVAEDEAEDTNDTSSAPSDTEDKSSTEDIVSTACAECSVLYVSADSSLYDRLDLIERIATENGVSTVGGDMHIGEKTLCSLYADPYDQGYRAGKLAYRILVDGEEPGTIKIGQPATEHLQKLYQDDIASALGMSFPKSFSDIDDFMESYVPGTNTTRFSEDE